MSDGAAKHISKASEAKAQPSKVASRVQQRMAKPAERSNGYMLQNSSPLRNQQDRPHEFYVKKSGCGER